MLPKLFRSKLRCWRVTWTTDGRTNILTNFVSFLILRIQVWTFRIFLFNQFVYPQTRPTHIQHNSGDMDIQNFSTLNVYFKSLTCIQYRRDIYMNWDTLFGLLCVWIWIDFPFTIFNHIHSFFIHPQRQSVEYLDSVWVDQFWALWRWRISLPSNYLCWFEVIEVVTAIHRKRDVRMGNSIRLWYQLGNLFQHSRWQGKFRFFMENIRMRSFGEWTLEFFNLFL